MKFFYLLDKTVAELPAKFPDAPTKIGQEMAKKPKMVILQL